MTLPIGRPLKYSPIILALDPDRLYTPAAIARFAVEQGYLGAEDEELALRRNRLRIALGRFSNNHDFPDEGDGMLTLPGQSPSPAWFGRRWQMEVHRRLDGGSPNECVISGTPKARRRFRP